MRSGEPIARSLTESAGATRGRSRTIFVGVLVALATMLAATLPAEAFDRAYRTTSRVSVSSASAEGDDNSCCPALSADGRFVAFFSYASNLVPGDTNGMRDVFVRALASGDTTRVSVSSAGGQGGGHSDYVALSADGGRVAFVSAANDLVAGDTNGTTDIFIHDMASGETTRVSLSTGGAQADGASDLPRLSRDGRIVAFQSDATNLVGGDTNGSTDIFVRDLFSGETTRVSVSSSGAEADDISWRPAVSGDGRFVVFQSYASNLVTGDSNGDWDVFQRDLQQGVTTRVSVSSTGAQGLESSDFPAISENGRYVSFASWSWNLVPGDTNSSYDVFLHDTLSGETTRVSVSSSGEQGDMNSIESALSSDARFVVFRSSASNLVPGDTNDRDDIFIHDMASGETTRVSVSSGDAQSNDDSWEPVISDDGRRAAFYSTATNLVGADANGAVDVFVRGAPPVSSLEVAPPSPDGDGGWYVAAPSVALSADDASATVYYRWDAGATQSYSATLTAAEGTHTFTYFSVDSLGTTEAARSSTFLVDTAPPTDPALSSPVHVAGTPSNIATVTVELSGAWDAASGVDGYSISWSAGASETPDAVKDEDGSLASTTTVLSEGTWYFNARSRDNAGNWTSTAHFGPVIIDLTAPAKPGFATVAAMDRYVDLGWVNPVDADFARTRLLRSTQGYASDAEGTDIVRALGDGQVLCCEGTMTAHRDLGLTNGVRYYYTLFARDTVGNWTAFDAAAASPAQPRGAAWLSSPRTPFVATRGVAFPIWGYLRPTHTGSTRLKLYRLVAGRWVYQTDLWAPNRRFLSFTRYSRGLRLGTTGSYKLVAFHGVDADHWQTHSAPRYFGVR